MPGNIVGSTHDISNTEHEPHSMHCSLLHWCIPQQQWLHLDIVDGHLTDLALCGLLQVVAGMLSRLQLSEGCDGLLLCMLCLHHVLGQKLPGRRRQLWCITQANCSTHLHKSVHNEFTMNTGRSISNISYSPFMQHACLKTNASCEGNSQAVHHTVKMQSHNCRHYL